MLEDVLGRVETDRALISEDENIRPKAPGMKYRHYAPKAELFIVEGEEQSVREKMNRLIEENKAAGRKAGVICTDESSSCYHGGIVKSIGRHGISGQKSSVLARAAFEETGKHLLHASLRGETDGLNGIIENIIIGQPIPLGTGSVSVTMKPDAYE